MHTALWKLFWFRIRGIFRSIVTKLKTLRGAALAVFTLLVFAAMLGPQLAMAIKLGRSGAAVQTADGFREVIPVVMLLFVVSTIVTSMGERALYFSPSEVDFLFPAPFSRRHILVYKILGNVNASIYVALIVPISMAMHIRSWPAAVIGCFLAWLMINSLTMCALLVAQTVTERAFTRARRLLLGGLIAATAVALGQAASRGLNDSWQEMLLGARHSPVAEIVLAPFTVFAKVITAERFVPDALGWAALGAIMVVGTYALAIRLDANYLETAARVSHQIQKRRLRAMRDGILTSPSGELRSSRLPQPPWWGGVGPVVWRQVLQALRGSRGVILLVVIMMLAFGLPMAFSVHRQNALTTVLPHMIIGAACYVTLLYSAQAPLGFRGDFERMDLLKSLPIRPLAMACGQTLVIVTTVTLLQWAVFAATAIFVPAAAAEMLAASLFIVPFNWILCGMENLLFLLYPSPLVVGGSDGFLKMGRAMLFMLAKFLVVGVCGGVAALLATLAYFLAGSMLAAFFVGWLTFLLPSLGIVLLIAWAFQRYDVTAGGVPE